MPAAAAAVRLGVTLLAVALGPPGPVDTGPGGPGLTLALDWRGAPASPEDRAALREAVAAALGDGRPPEAVRDRALARARVAVAYELPADLRADQRVLRATLDDADAAYREGRFAEAQARIDAALAALDAHPQLQGAASSAREALVLGAKLAWAQAQPEQAQTALAAAVALDPQAQLSVREAAPALVERYRAIQAELLANQATTWLTPSVALPPGTDDPSLRVEIDGVEGLRPVPPGRHLLVARRDGHVPVATWRELSSPANPWTLDDAAPRLGDAIEDHLAEVCEILELDALVLAERRHNQMGVQVHDCEAGIGPRSIGPPEQLAASVAAALAGPFAPGPPTLAATWPSPSVAVASEQDPDPAPPPRHWTRKGWIWGTGAGVSAAIVGGVVAGVLLGGRDADAPMVHVDSGNFIGSGIGSGS